MWLILPLSISSSSSMPFSWIKASLCSISTCLDDAFSISELDELSLFFSPFTVFLGKGESRGKPKSESASINNSNKVLGVTQQIAWQGDSEITFSAI